MTKAEAEMAAREQREAERRRMRWEAACAAMTGLLAAGTDVLPTPMAVLSMHRADALLAAFEASELKS